MKAFGKACGNSRDQRVVSRRRVATAVAAMLAVGLGAADHAWANFRSMAQRLPASTNAIVAINVEKVLATPYAQKEWSPTAADAWAKQPAMIPPGSQRLLSAAEVRTDSMESFWELCLMEMAKVPSLQALAGGEGGYVDRVWDKDAVASPINAYFIPLDGTTLASVTPANRGGIARWLRTSGAGKSEAVTSEYIKGVLGKLGEQTDIVMAIDLEGAFGVPHIRRWLDDNAAEEVKQDQAASVAGVLGTLKGITLTATVGEDVKGRAVIDFDKETNVLQAAAKPLMVKALRTAGMRIDDVEQWNFTAGNKQVVAEGKLSTPALRNLLGLVQSPIPAATVAAQADAKQPNVPSDPAQASQRYYKVISANLDNFRGGTSAAESASWARATAKRIEQLPILNVDPQLVQWGSMVALKLKQAAATMAVGQTQINSRIAGVADPGYGQYQTNEAGATVYEQDRAEVENAKRQRRQLSLEQKAQAQEQAMKILSEVAETRPQIRQAMVEKYKVEF